MKELRKAFDRYPIEPFPPKLVYRFVDSRSKKIAAHREIEVLSHAFTKAVEWGLIDRHPFKGQVRLQGEKERDRSLDDDELQKVSLGQDSCRENKRTSVAVWGGDVYIRKN